MLHDLRRLSTDAFPEDFRAQARAELPHVCFRAWRACRTRRRYPGLCVVTPVVAGSVFVRVQSSLKVLVPHPANATRCGAAMLVAAVLEGSGPVVEINRRPVRPLCRARTAAHGGHTEWCCRA